MLVGKHNALFMNDGTALWSRGETPGDVRKD